MKDLSELRQEIDVIDKELLGLFERRMDVAAQVGDYKRAHHLPVLDSGRERQVLENRLARVKNPAYTGYAEQLFLALMDYSKDLQRQSTPPSQAENGLVAYQGVPGAYSQEAAKRFAPQAELVPKEDFEQVFLAVSKGEVDYGVVPVENSASGSITAIYDLLGKYQLWIYWEMQIGVDHVLLGPKNARLEDVCQVYSHEQGLLQCSKFLAAHPEWSQIPYRNTAVSAKLVAEEQDPKKAAIASAYAGEIYGLQVLADKIADSPNNHTRFFVVTAGKRVASPDKASLLFVLSHVRGSLAAMLQKLAELGYNLTKIESRPIRTKNWEYRFYVDLEGDMSHLEADLPALQVYCSSLRLLGIYRKAEA